IWGQRPSFRPHSPGRRWFGREIVPISAHSHPGTGISLNPDRGRGQGIQDRKSDSNCGDRCQGQEFATEVANFWKKSSASFLAAPLTKRCPSWASFPPICASTL